MVQTRITGASISDMEQEVVQGGTPSIGSANVCANWYENCCQQGRGSAANMQMPDLIGYVRGQLFSKLKFFMHERQLDFSLAQDSFCFTILKDMHVPENEYAKWWELHKKKIVQGINSKRGDVSATIKWVFISKWSMRGL